MVNCLKCQHLTEKWKCEIYREKSPDTNEFDDKPCSKYAEVTCDACRHCNHNECLSSKGLCCPQLGFTHGVPFDKKINDCDCFDRVFAAKKSMLIPICNSCKRDYKRDNSCTAYEAILKRDSHGLIIECTNYTPIIEITKNCVRCPHYRGYEQKCARYGNDWQKGKEINVGICDGTIASSCQYYSDSPTCYGCAQYEIHDGKDWCIERKGLCNPLKNNCYSDWKWLDKPTAPKVVNTPVRNCVQCGEYRGKDEFCAKKFNNDHVRVGKMAEQCPHYHAAATCWNCEKLGFSDYIKENGHRIHLCNNLNRVQRDCTPNELQACKYHIPLTAPRPIPTKTTLTCDECPEEKECYLPGCSDEHKQAILKSTWDQAAYETKCRDVFVPALEKEFGIKMKQCENPDRTPYWDHFNGDHSNYMQIQSWNGQKATIKLNDYPITATTTAADLIAFFRQYVPKLDTTDCTKCQRFVKFKEPIFDEKHHIICVPTDSNRECKEFKPKSCTNDSCADKTQCSPCSEKIQNVTPRDPILYAKLGHIPCNICYHKHTQGYRNLCPYTHDCAEHTYNHFIDKDFPLGQSITMTFADPTIKTEESINTEIKGAFDGEIECPKCQAKNPAAAKFCCLCGKKVKRPKTHRYEFDFNRSNPQFSGFIALCMGVVNLYISYMLKGDSVIVAYVTLGTFLLFFLMGEYLTGLKSTTAPKEKKVKPAKVPTAKPVKAKPTINLALCLPTPPHLRMINAQELEYNKLRLDDIYPVGCEVCKAEHGDNKCHKYFKYPVKDDQICDDFASNGHYCKSCHIYHNHFKCPLCHRR